jgi:cardiolipin synthase
MFRFLRFLSKPLLVLLSVIVTIVLMLVVVNFAGGEHKVTHKIERLYSVEDPQFQRTMGLMLGPSIVGGNKVDVLLNGDQIFPAMLTAIRAAKKTISFETYIYWSEAIGEEFAQALAERARAGVKVHLLVDALGSSKLDQAQMTTMTTAGVDIRKYRPLKWYNAARLNNRTHRKLLVVDGKIGFTGGVGIAGQWTGHAQDPAHWRDSHFRIEGPVVAQMQAVLLDNWNKTTGIILHGEDYFPPLTAVGDEATQVFSSSPTSGSESMALMYLLSITAAKKSIDLSAAYFVPDDLMRGALVAAVKRGVRVRIIMPGKNIDTEAVRLASQGGWGDLLTAGAQLYEYQPTMFHTKEMVVDNLLVSVGSTNFDTRSFRLNDEANLNIFSSHFAQTQTAIFEQDLRNAKRVTLAQWEARPWEAKVVEYLLARFGGFL